ncbi:hypothetical protein B0J17DRAFT_632171 [Rhizoctonia solani]|nr:hypothetical protein B0J17DRAFT_632171 [Rhizoctonia solani]
MPWELLMGTLGDHALYFMERSLQTHVAASSDESNSTTFTAPLFVEQGTLNRRDAQLLIELMLMFQSENISLRGYLGCLLDAKQTHCERRIYYRINQFIFGLLGFLDVATTHDIWLPVDEDDACTIVKMYSNLLSPYPETPLVLSSIISRWVFCLLMNPKKRQPAFDKLMPNMFTTALGVLQKEIDKESEYAMREDNLDIVRLVTHDTLEQICVFHSNEPDAKVWDTLLKALFDSDLYGAMGRILTLIMRETGKSLSPL